MAIGFFFFARTYAFGTFLRQKLRHSTLYAAYSLLRSSLFPRTVLKRVSPVCLIFSGSDGIVLHNMMDTLGWNLKKLGLKENETILYLHLLREGSLGALAIANQLNIPRPTVYTIIETLRKKGLVMETNQGKHRCFQAEPPDKLLEILRHEKRVMEEKERELLRIIAELRAFPTSGSVRVLVLPSDLSLVQELFQEEGDAGLWYVCEKKSKGRIGDLVLMLKEYAQKKFGREFNYHEILLLSEKETHSSARPAKRTSEHALLFSDGVAAFLSPDEGFLIKNKHVAEILRRICSR